MTMRPIDADALITEIEETPLTMSMFANSHDCYTARTTKSMILGIVKDAPTISPDEVRGVGEWIEAAGGNYLVCPECKYDHALYDRLGYSCEHEYCPNCGKRLRMKGVSEDV